MSQCDCPNCVENREKLKSLSLEQLLGLVERCRTVGLLAELTGETHLCMAAIYIMSDAVTELRDRDPVVMGAWKAAVQNGAEISPREFFTGRVGRA